METPADQIGDALRDVFRLMTALPAHTDGELVALGEAETHISKALQALERYSETAT